MTESKLRMELEALLSECAAEGNSSVDAPPFNWQTAHKGVADSLRAILANNPEKADEAKGEAVESYWLIERNSKHKDMPPNESVMWFRGRACFAAGDVDNWTPEAHKARHFATKAAAEEYVRESMSDGFYDPLPDVTEHIDCVGPAPHENAHPAPSKEPQV